MDDTTELIAKVSDHVDDLAWAEALIFVFPTWYFGPPAILKGWFERVWLPGVAFEEAAEKGPITSSCMRHIKRLVVITTSGSPAWWIFVIGNPCKRFFMRGLRVLFARSCKSSWMQLYEMNVIDEVKRKKFLKRVAQKMATVSVRKIQVCSGFNFRGDQLNFNIELLAGEPVDVYQCRGRRRVTKSKIAYRHIEAHMSTPGYIGINADNVSHFQARAGQYLTDTAMHSWACSRAPGDFTFRCHRQRPRSETQTGIRLEPADVAGRGPFLINHLNRNPLTRKEKMRPGYFKLRVEGVMSWLNVKFKAA